MRNIVDKIIQTLITVIMVIMVVAVCWQVFTRYILGNPSTVTEEALRYLLVWSTMVGAAYAYGRGKHISINILVKKLPEKQRLIHDTLIQCIVIAFSVLVMIMGGLNLSKTAEGMHSAALGIPMQYVYYSLIVGAILFIFYACIFIKENIEKFAELNSIKGEGKKA